MCFHLTRSRFYAKFGAIFPTTEGGVMFQEAMRAIGGPLKLVGFPSPKRGALHKRRMFLEPWTPLTATGLDLLDFNFFVFWKIRGFPLNPKKLNFLPGDNSNQETSRPSSSSASAGVLFRVLSRWPVIGNRLLRQKHLPVARAGTKKRKARLRRVCDDQALDI